MDERKLAQDQQTLLGKLEAARDVLLSFPNTLAVGIGIKESARQFTEEIAYRVFVTEKKDPGELRADEVIPATIDGIRTDVLEPYRIKDRIDVCGDERETLSKHRPLQAGISISKNSAVGGTLGWFGTLVADDSLVLLTNKHVLYDSTNETITAARPTAQPRLGRVSHCCCCECGSDNVIGQAVVGVRTMLPLSNTSVDCGIARINDELSTDLSLVITNDATSEVLTVSGTAVAVVGQTVRKIGARSGFTRGVVVHVGDAATAGTDPEGDPILVLTGQVLVIPHASETYQIDDRGTCKFAFSADGDSGSVILNDSNEIVALLYGGDERPNSVDVTFANNIDNVITALDDAGFQITIRTSAEDGDRGRAAVRKIERVRVPETVGYFEKLRDANRESLLNALYQRHHREILELINRKRPVTVAWQRSQGPAFVAALARTARVEPFDLPQSIEGVSREDLLTSMKAVLIKHGSLRLKRDIASHGTNLYAAFTQEGSVEEITQRLHTMGYLDALPLELAVAR